MLSNHDRCQNMARRWREPRWSFGHKVEMPCRGKMRRRSDRKINWLRGTKATSILRPLMPFAGGKADLPVEPVEVW